MAGSKLMIVAALVLVATAGVATAQCNTDRYTTEYDAYTACVAEHPIDFCQCQDEFSSYYIEALECAAVLPATTLATLESTEVVYANCGGEECDLGQFFEDSQELQDCLNANNDGVNALCNCTDEYEAYLELGSACIDLLPEGLRDAVNDTKTQWREACESSGGDDGPSTCDVDEYNRLQDVYSTCLTDSGGDVCACRSDFDASLDEAIICGDVLPEGLLSSMRATAAFVHTACDSESVTTLQFSPDTYTASSTDATQDVTVTRRGPPDGEVSARVAVFVDGEFTGQVRDVTFPDGSADAVTVSISLVGLGPTGVALSRDVTVTLGSVSGPRASLGVPATATVTIEASSSANTSPQAILVQVPGAGVTWALDTSPKTIRFDTRGMSHTSNLRATLRLHASASLDANVTSSWMLETAQPLPSLGGSAVVTLPAAAIAAATTSDAYSVQVEDVVTGTSATSALFTATTATSMTAPVVWNATVTHSVPGSGVMVVASDCTIAWRMDAGGDAASTTVSVSVVHVANGNGTTTMVAHIGDFAQSVSSTTWTVADVMDAVVAAAGVARNGVTQAGVPGFAIRVQAVNSYGLSDAWTSPPFAFAPAFTFVTSSWSSCSATCGDGNQTRTTECMATEALLDGGVTASAVPVSLCGTAIPATTQHCILKPCLPQAAAYSTGGWQACSAACGGGVQVQELSCLDSSGDTVPLAVCEDQGVAVPAAAERPCNMQPCESFAWVAGPWGECSAPCGGGQAMRTVRCAGSLGTVHSPTACASDLQSRPSDVKECNNATCAAAQWQVGAWTACNATCGGTGYTTRTVECVDAAGTTVADTACSGVGAAPSSTRVCNTGLCATYRWAVGAWSACSAVCGSGATRARTLTCVDASTGASAADSACAGIPSLSETASCGVGLCDACSAFGGACGSPQGTCSAGVCVCEAGFFGDFCRSTETACPDGVFDANATCCASGVLSASGTCCVGAGSAVPAVDGSGQCCASGVVDECGVCGGTGVLDVYGACCAHGATDASGACCYSGAVDLCGVCDGTSTSCHALVQADWVLDVNASTLLPEQSFMWTRYETVTMPQRLATASGVSASRFTAASLGVVSSAAVAGDTTPVHFAIASPSGSGDASAFAVARAMVVSPPAFATVSAVSTLAVCGNGVCEFGEACVEHGLGECCPSDCGMLQGECPFPVDARTPCGDHGRCAVATGECVCDYGYDGPECTWCATGYAQTVNGECAPVFTVSLSYDTGGTTTGGSSGTGTTTTTTTTTTTGGISGTTTGGSTSGSGSTSGGSSSTTGGSTTSGSGGDGGSGPSAVVVVIIVVAVVGVVGVAAAVFKPWRYVRSTERLPSFANLQNATDDFDDDHDGAAGVHMVGMKPLEGMSSLGPGGALMPSDGAAPANDTSSIPPAAGAIVVDKAADTGVPGSDAPVVTAPRWVEERAADGSVVMKDRVTGAEIPVV